MAEAKTRPGTVGAPVRRVEDRRFLTGQGRYLDDIRLDGMLSCVVLRSQHAHARFRLEGVDEARRHPGVHLILTSADLDALGPMPVRNSSVQPDGSKPSFPPHPVLARETVHFVGEPVAFIAAETREIAAEAAEMIGIDYDPIDVVTEPRAALTADAPVLHPAHGSNLVFEYELGDRDATEAAFARANRVTRIRLKNNRVAAAFLETRGAVGEFDPATGRYTLTLGTQGGLVVRRMLAEVLKVDQSKLRIITPDVGGAFGTKIFTFPEYALAAVAAERTGRPVKWIGDRAEHFLGDSHGREQDVIAEMAMDLDGRFLAMRVDLVANVGAYCSEMGAWVPFGSAKMGAGSYDVPALFSRVRGAYTNTGLVDAYRGAGRPEASYLIERLVDACGAETGLGQAEIRRRNLIRSDQMPYATASGWTYDTGDYRGHMERTIEAADFAGFDARAGEARGRGMLRGIGLAAHVDACAPPGQEQAQLTLDAEGGVTVLIGTQTGGQGHATAYSQFVVQALGIGYDRVNVVQGDTDRIPFGGGTGGSRSIPLGAIAVDKASRAMAERLRVAAGEMLEAAAADIELSAGQARVAGTDRAISLADIARRSGPEGVKTAEIYEPTDRTYPNGSHACEIEIDPATGQVRIVNYVVVDDFGFVVNPMLLAGQIHGGVAQGIGQALMEHVVYDETGQLMTASFLDYCVPRAGDLPNFAFETRNVPGNSNPLGIRGAGEAGCMGSCPAVMNAVADALRRAGVDEWVDMPATPARIWAMLASAGKAGS